MRTTRLLLFCLLSTGLALAGCKRDAAPGTPDGAAGAAHAAGAAGAATVDGDSVAALDEDAAGPIDLGEFKVVSVLLGDALDGEGIVRTARSDFAPTATLYASVLSTGAHPGFTLAARWRAPDGQVILESGQLLAPTQPTATTFTLKGAAPWPGGDYVLELRANGRLLQKVPFTVH